MKLVLLAIIVIAFCIIGLSFNIIFRKNGKFPDGEIAHNKALKEKGIECAKMEELRIWGKKKNKITLLIVQGAIKEIV
jgi:hypothetical protein